MAEIVERVVRKYYKAMDEGKVLGRKCPACGNVEWPPVYACNACGCMDTEWIEMSKKGVIKILLMPTVMSSRPAYNDLEPYAYCAVQAKEGPERNVMVLNVNKENADYIRAHLPYPVHMEIVERDGFKTAVFAIDPIDKDGNPVEKTVKKVKASKLSEAQKAMTENTEGNVEVINISENDREIKDCVTDGNEVLNSGTGSSTTDGSIVGGSAATNSDAAEVLDPEVFKQLASIVADAYKVDASVITPETKFEGEFKASSVVFVGIVARIENEFDVFMTITDASTSKTVGALAARIQKAMEDA